MSQHNSEFHKIIQFIEKLGRNSPVQLTSEEIADVLWLTLKREKLDNKENITPNSNVDSNKNVNSDKIDNRDQDQDDQTNLIPPIIPPTNTTHSSNSSLTDSSSTAPVYSSSDSSSNKNLSIGIPDAASIRKPLTLIKYLRLLIQKVPSGREVDIDEEATVKQIAEEKNWIPILEEELEPWLDLALVIDESSSMLIWSHTITDLKKIFQNYGIFRDLKVWGIKLDETKEQMQLISRNGSNSRIANPKEIVDPTRRRLILIISDCVSSLWRKGIIFPTLNLWAKQQPLAIIQILPNLMWDRSALGLGMLVNLSSSRLGAANQDLISSKIPPSPDATKIPILSLEPDHLFRWTEMLVGKRESSITGYLLPSQLNVNDYPLLKEQQQAIDNQNASERIDRFRRMTSPLGRKLAGLLAASPVIRFPIVRLIQESLLPDSGQIQIAEVFLGGLLKPKAGFSLKIKTNPEAVEYEFVEPEIRDLFLEDSPETDSSDVLNAVSRYIAEQMGITTNEFMGYLKSSDTKSDERNKLQPFAEVTIRILKKLGGDYVRLAEDIEKSRSGRNKSVPSDQATKEKRKVESMNDVLTKSNATIPALIYCNLPHRYYPNFIGREEERQQLLRQISPNYRQHIATVEGIGGVGKTALVLEAAYLCWEARQKQIKANQDIPIFDAIIFTSAKETYLTPQGILKRPRFEETLQKIFRTIANVLNEPSIIMAQKEEEQIDLVYQSLSKQRTLLIIDNMETIFDNEQDAVLSFLDNLPPPTQAITTSRQRTAVRRSIRIYQLSREESFQLIAQEAENKAIKITDYQAKRFYSTYGGIPIALIYAVGQRAMGYSLKKILGLYQNLPPDLALFLFKGSVEPLRGQAAHKLLMSITFFQTAPSKDALVTVAGLQGEPHDVEEGLAKLQQLSLLSEKDRFYSILPITHKYALDELAKYPEFLEEARNRWVEWYLKFTKKYGGKDWQDWRIRYDYLAQEWENIASVLYWCAAQDKYEEVKLLWKNIDRYVDLGCYWRTRRHWWGWLIKQSDRRADLATYVRALSERAWTLTLMGDDEAERDIDEAWKMREHAELDVQVHLANHIAVHRITQKKYDKALKWLQRQEQLVNEARFEEKEQIRYQVCIAYYRAEIAYRKWEKTENQEDYNLAKEQFQWAFDKGKEIGWQRFTNYAQNWLSEIFIIENNLRQAEKLLKEGLFVTERNRERRRIGHYLASYARLEAKRKNYEKARDYANKAISIFDKEGIREDAQEMRKLNSGLP